MSARGSSPVRKTFPVAKRRAGLKLTWDRDLSRRLREALEEDVGPGDVTTERIVPQRLQGEGSLTAKATGIFCGAPVADRLWRIVSPSVAVRWRVNEGGRVRPGQIVAKLSGPYRALLTGERVALNFLQRMSGTATLTDRIVKAAGGDRGPQICDTRKTTPLWRKLQRYAVRAGGGVNHRFGLFDMVLIKHNHVEAAGTLAAAVRKARAARPKMRIAAEARNSDEVRQACEERADLILLDNMSPAQVRAALKRFGDAGIPFEVSGGVTLRNIKAYARTGVDRISIGALTHSAPALDLALTLRPARKDSPR